jgi:hypothetical protein
MSGNQMVPVIECPVLGSLQFLHKMVWILKGHWIPVIQFHTPIQMKYICTFRMAFPLFRRHLNYEQNVWAVEDTISYQDNSWDTEYGKWNLVFRSPLYLLEKEMRVNLGPCLYPRPCGTGPATSETTKLHTANQKCETYTYPLLYKSYYADQILYN